MTEKRKAAKVDPYKPLLDGIVELLEESRRVVGRTVNAIITSCYWEIGRRIVDEEQRGSPKAAYGDQLVEQLSTDLTARFGRGFSRTNVFQMRQFYLAFREIVQTPSGQSPTVPKIQTIVWRIAILPAFLVTLCSTALCSGTAGAPLIRGANSSFRLVRSPVGSPDRVSVFRTLQGCEATPLTKETTGR